MFEASTSISEFVRGKSLDDLRQNDLLRAGIYYKFVVVGEAMSQLAHDDESTAERMTEYSRIIAFRNQIIHGYGKIDDEITWRIVEQKLPLLLSELRALLAE
ncbi:MAG TPA: DUF86 domain-containing protein [Tepidisphaeraceae bacterium]|nr:DUF86 domain-containing protein [Tepidisphaeraceae bacterium]